MMNQLTQVQNVVESFKESLVPPGLGLSLAHQISLSSTISPSPLLLLHCPPSGQTGKLLSGVSAQLDALVKSDLAEAVVQKALRHLCFLMETNNRLHAVYLPELQGQVRQGPEAV